ncbi:hypothetical protein CCY99_04240 [Helicobacter sp. 16-1353]|uniref:sensor histidine kinase n=1 Tax=Helicobacter sp. 16-1353 TaxID=2004996 RepID=UPI000DCC65F7|nr:HAMP domain-containing sensor histidine kinase [Helicobacter sp. 16-1353]RAX54227.1 hypothetical protein CCY99_04240 [Helicobacter sp. 16-1353]
MFDNSKTTIIKILLLYLGTSAIFLCIGFYNSITKETENIIFAQMADLRDISFEIHNYLRKNNNDVDSAIPEILQHINTPFAIYDKNYDVIFSNLSQIPDMEGLRRGFYNANGKIIANPSIIPHRDKKGMKRKPPPFPYKIFLEDSSLDSKILFTKLKFSGYFILIFALMGIVATILVRMFLKPINEYIQTLDTFIKDTTHEINTPLSVILMSIETLKKDNIEEQKKLERIKLASLQLSQIYNDLVAYNFPHSIQSPVIKLSLDSILKERLDFFTPFFIQKKLNIYTNIKNAYFDGSREKFVLLFDNLLSNAIKYNSKGGSINISLEQGKFVLQDSGKGINTKDLDKIYERYSRFNKDSGGFGIGLFIVKKICDEYNININVNTSDKGTIFTLIW